MARLGARHNRHLPLLPSIAEVQDRLGTAAVARYMLAVLLLLRLPESTGVPTAAIWTECFAHIGRRVIASECVCLGR